MGEEWLAYLSVAPFLYEDVFADETCIAYQAYYKAFVLHCKWLQIMLRRSLSIDDINLAEKMCMKWRSWMTLLYPSTKFIKRPNFHNVIHVFPFAKLWGPPILYWARPFGM